MSNTQNVLNKTPDTPPSTGKAGGGLGLNLSSGMEAAVTVALSHLEQILCDINNKELEETQGMAKAIKETSIYSAQNTIKNGEQAFYEALGQGLGMATGAGLSLGLMWVGYYKDPNKSDLENVKQQEEGVNNYKEALPKKFKASINESEKTESTEPQVQGPKTKEEALAAQAKVDHANEVAERLTVLKKQSSFTDEKGKALKVSEMKGDEATQTDDKLIGAMSKDQVNELKESLDNRLEKLAEQKQTLANKQSSRRQTFSTIGQAAGQVVQGTTNAGVAFEKKEQGESQAAAALSNSAAQGMASVMAQLLKTANDALSQAQQTIQTFATISNGNKFQG